jgi:hypothetical protein
MIEGVGTGYLRFISDGQDTYVISINSERFGEPYEGNKAVSGKVTTNPDGTISWTFSGLVEGETQTVTISANSKLLNGKAAVKIMGEQLPGYSWIAALVTQETNDPAYNKISNLCPEQYLIGMKQKGNYTSSPVVLDGFSPWAKYDPGASNPINTAFDFYQKLAIPRKP